MVVLPLVPVTATTVSCSEGAPKKQAASSARARRVEGTVMTTAPAAAGRSATTATAPRRTASSMNAWPSAARPRMATKRPPAVTS